MFVKRSQCELIRVVLFDINISGLSCTFEIPSQLHLDPNDSNPKPSTTEKQVLNNLSIQGLALSYG